LESDTGKKLIEGLKDEALSLLSRGETIEEQAMLAREAIGRRDALMTILTNAKEQKQSQGMSDFVDSTAGLL
jgi:hypothetical protein